MFDLSNAEFLLKEMYTQDYMRNLAYKDNVLHALLPKMFNFGGENLPTPTIFSSAVARSATFAKAKQIGEANASTKGVKFKLERKKDYAYVLIDAETMKASAVAGGSFAEAATTDINSGIKSLNDSIAISEYGDGSGVIAKVSAEPAETAGTFVLNLQNPDDSRNLEVGQVFSIYSPAGVIRTSNGTTNEFQLTAINRVTGALTLQGTYNATGDIQAGDGIAAAGDYGLKLSGLQAWLPSSINPATDNFYGVNRGADVERLGGVKISASGLSIDDAFVKAVRDMERVGSVPSHIMTTHKRWADLELALGAKVQYTEVASQEMPTIGFKGIRIHGQRSPVVVLADINCPSSTSFVLQMNTWQLCCLGEPVHVVEEDGGKWLRAASADAFEMRLRFYGNLRCFAPGFNGRIDH